MMEQSPSVSATTDEPGLRSLLDALPSPALYTDFDLEVLECNLQASLLLGYSADELYGRQLSQLLAQGVHVKPAVLEDRFGPQEHFVAIWTPKAGPAFAADTLRKAVCGADGERLGFLLLVTDPVTQTENSERIVAQQEAERLSLARELHDGPVQELISVGFSLAMLSRSLKDRLPESDVGAVQQIQAKVTAVSRLLRSVVSNLRPAGLEQFGLIASLEMVAAKLVREYPGNGLDLRLDLEEIHALTHPQQLCLYRATQEALQNCLRHGHANVVTVTLRRVGDQGLLTIADDGVGFKVPLKLKDLLLLDHYGLAGMAERVELIGGDLLLRSAAGQGTRLEIRVQLEDSVEAPCA